MIISPHRADFNNGNCTDHQKAVIASALRRDSCIAGNASTWLYPVTCECSTILSHK
ncbi:hypothetical protein SSAG_06652, partial [Streptomyces sp. Mg1]